jgi:dipeptidyl aminopeptidase/acylaminoacyl peptidase
MTRRILVLLSSCALFGAVPLPQIPHIGSKPSLTGRLHTYGSVAISPDGKRVMALETIENAENDTSNVPPPSALVIYKLGGGGTPHTIKCGTPADCTISSPVWAPESDHVAFIVRDKKANTTEIWTAKPDEDAGRPLVRGFKGVMTSLKYASNGALAVLATANAHKEVGATQAGAALVGDIGAKPDEQRIAVVEAAGTLSYVTPPDTYVYEYDWSPDATKFVATAAKGDGDNNWWFAKLAIADIASKGFNEIYTPPLQINAPRWSPDGKTIAFIGGLMSDFGSVGGDVFAIAPGGGAATDITPNLPGSANSLTWAQKSDRITFTMLEGDKQTIATATLHGDDVKTLWAEPVSIGANGEAHISYARDGQTTALVRQSFESPPTILVGRVGSWLPLTHDNEAFRPVLRSQSITWTDDGRNVQGWLLTPREVVPGKKYPMIVNVHGGPSAASTPYFIDRGTTKALIRSGYMLFYPNPRGSFGQGEAFTRGNVKDFGGGDLRDILSGVDAVEKSMPIDDARLGITGGSYGGYMTMWAVTQTHRFRAAVAGAGLSDWLSYYGENGIDTWMLPFFGASVYDDPAVYAKSSPINFIKQAKTPMFIYVGERDVEVPAPQSFEMWHALKDLGVPTELIVYEGEGHGIRSAAHRKSVEEHTVAWFDKYLK